MIYIRLARGLLLVLASVACIYSAEVGFYL